MRSIAFCLAAVALFFVPSASAGGLLVPRDGSPPIGMSSHRVSAVVEEGLARTTVRQTFVNPHGRALEAIYLFPLPEGAALIDVAMETGGQRLEGLLAERKRARKVYDEIVRRQRDPALVEQIGANTFRLSVYPVLPGEDTVVELTWISLVPLIGGELNYVYPLAVGAKTVAIEQDFAIAVQLRSSVPFTEVKASSAAMEVVRPAPGQAIVAMEVTEARLDRDLVVTAGVASEKADLSLRTFRSREGDGWFQAVITPPTARPDQWIPRDVILVVDTSGSMQGEKIEQAKASALWLLENLRSIDRVNVLRFSTDVRAFAAEPVPATADNLARLEEFVRGIEAGGGTALGDALVEATKVEAAAGRVRTVVLLSDGKPTIGETSSGPLVAVAKAAGERGLRVYPFGVGEDVDGALLRGLAAAGRGRAELFRPGGEIVTRLTRFLTRTAAPVFTDVELAIEGVEVHGVQPRTLPDLYLGEQLIITGRYCGGGEGAVRVSGTMGGSKKSLASPGRFPAEPGGSSTVKHLHARALLTFLEEARRLRLGLGDDAYYAALDRGAYSTTDEIVAEMIDVSLEHGVQCAYTSFLVLLEEDRHRIDPRDAEALQAALERVPRRAGEELEEEDIEEDASFRVLGSRDGAAPSDPGAPDFLGDSPFDDEEFNDVIGIGGGAGGSFGGRFGGRRNLRASGGSGTGQALKDALEWLAKHQEVDGRWAAAGFADHCSGDEACGGPGTVESDIGVTGLCLLAFMGDGHTSNSGLYQDLMRRGFEWLRQQQDPTTGLIGQKVGHSYMYDHAIATLALCEAYNFSKSPLLREVAQRAVMFLVIARNPYGVWRYDSPPVGDNDTSVTGWCVMALKAADEAGLKIDEQAFNDALDWFDEVTDPATGRVGYDSMGSRSARVPGMNDNYPVDRTEAMTAIGLFCRFLLGQDPATKPVMGRHADLLARSLPSWDPQGMTNDLYYWYYGSYAMYQMGGNHWKTWNGAMKKALLDSQRKDGCHKGSWDPIGPWGYSGGRIYSTALGALCMEAYFRHARIQGDSPSDEKKPGDAVGVGGGAGGKFGGRVDGARRLKVAVGSVDTGQALKDALEWLAGHQEEDGRWAAAGFATHCSAGEPCGGPGGAQNDVGVTGLCLLAFLGDGHTTRQGLYQERLRRGFEWLGSQQDPKTGLIGQKVGFTYMYDHAIATLALTELYTFTKSPSLKDVAQLAIDFLQRARNPYGVWRYDSPPVGDNDTSVTGWCVMALKSAQGAGLSVEEQAFDDALSWFDEVTDRGTARVGYDSVGSRSARVPDMNDNYPVDRTEAMTAIGLFCRFLLGQDPAKETVMGRHADLLAKSLPTWNTDGLTSDFYYWYHGSNAMYQMGGQHWKVWNRALKKALLDSQCRDECAKGSWDPIGPWGYSGGRLYSTALGALCLEAHFRYAKVSGPR